MRALAQDTNSRVALSASIVLWQLDSNSISPLQSVLLRTNQPPFELRTLTKLGPAGQPLAPIIEEAIAVRPWCQQRMELVHVLWTFDRDQDKVLKQFQSLGTVITNQYGAAYFDGYKGWTFAEEALSYAVKYELAEVPEFRAALEPLLLRLERTRATIVSPADPSEYWASMYLRRLQKMDQDTAKTARPAPSAATTMKIPPLNFLPKKSPLFFLCLPPV